MYEFDPERVSRTIAGALAGPGGVAMVVKVFAGLPGVIHTPARRGFFSSSPERVQIGDWRYEIARDGRLLAGHVVNGIVIAEDVLAADAVGPHVTRSLHQIVGRYGASVIPNINAAVDVLGTSTGYSY
ncbi:DUF5073 domain-containing protein [Mycobacterium paragordonae]|jgi:hypothetical protein|uniref:DUF5073 domain-containing protein n=1 Tax=Mycobacterium paragordonae TaxID=1389713 RepID=A0AAJ1S7M2_9MYCO|nr:MULTISPECIES: DUF5073 family protein [Mycobacterium]PJE23286.1 MAG: DUF5073 domain-containing protein [Mycobacterium sp.]AYE95941.1 DUF5073 domain-containing protein [Mycobacterium paragordonae]MDP7734978.1 DUF5073 family protein [Mycobacterium paragordonae]OBJ75761.1 DUF5073 domain-containing protein [Mycobacterium gordonae]OBK48676.1 DUF5073 domain-containing protein [Mycobacterium gordonae]